MLIEWREEFTTGIAALDHEHRSLIDLINALYAALPVAKARADVLAFLDEIHARIAAHFALEEKIMRARRYDGYLDHKTDHERLLDEIRDITDLYEDDARFDEAALVRRLTEWFAVHFRTRDARLHRHLA